MTEGQENLRYRKGAGLQFLGSVLLGLGLLNAMLGLKTGAAPDLFNYLLFLSGGVMLSAGIWRGRNG